MKTIALHGATGVGKDTVFSIISRELHAQRFAFADPVRAAAKAAFSLTDDWLTDEYKTRTHPFWNLTPREMTQKVGTECFRHVFGEDFWTRRLELALHDELDTDAEYAVITDLRFPNELEWCRARRIQVIHVVGPRRRGDVNTNHVSNVPLPFKPGSDYQLNNYSTLADLETNVMDMLDWLENTHA